MRTARLVPRRRPPGRVRTLAAGAMAVLTAAATAAPPDGTPSTARLQLLVYPSPGLFDLLPDGRIGGPGGVLVDKIGQASQVAYKAESLPIARAVATGLSHPNSCIVGVVRTPERESLFRWVGLVSRAGLAVYSRADDTPPLSTLTDLRGRRVVVLRETVNAAQLRDQGIEAQEVSGALGALRMLRAGRVDYWYSHTLVAEPAASAASGAPVRAAFSTPRVDGYLACHPDLPAALAERLSQGLSRLRRQGDLADFGLR